ncbi:MAG: insulinase family protein [Bacteroidia bacterium]|nr:insulinase family protein [Bacteroidia bacterium]
MEFQTHIFSNGIRLIHKQVDARAAYFGLIVNAGSRDEAEEEHGMAHFIEHTIFKGTQKRNTYRIISRLEDVGGDLDAYTTKEETFIYASFLKNDYEKAIELIWDIVFNSTFPDKELEKEKLVIYDEINSYKDSPAEQIFDDFEELVFRNHPIGKNILGTPAHLKRFGKKHIEKFMKANYCTDEMVLSSVGDISFSKLVTVTEKYFGVVPTNIRKNKRIKFNSYKPEYKTVKKDTHQSHCIIGNIAYDVRDKKRVGLILLNNILAGQNMNSRLNMSLREKHGYVYTVESGYAQYSDTGILTIYFGTDKDYLGKSMNLVYKELEKLRTQKISVSQLEKAKKQIIGQITISSESNPGLMIAMAKSHLLYNRVDTLEKIYRKIENISAEELLEIANEVLDKNRLTTLIFS